MKKWRCRICGYIHTGENPPLQCPVCQASADDFKPMEDFFSTAAGSAIKKIIIIGNGAAGMEAARTVRENNSEVEILLFSDENHPFYSRIHLSTFIGDDSSIEKITIYPKNWYEENRITVILNNQVVEINPDKQIVIDNHGVSHSYDRLIIATGASPFVPPIMGIDKEGVSLLRNLEHALQIRKKMDSFSSAIIIGGGILGIEAASSLNKTGKKVTIIELSDRLMPQQLDSNGSKILSHILETRGISVLTSTRIEEIFGDTQVEGIRLSSGQKLAAQFVILATGIVPNIALAKQVGINVHRGIIVNERLETSRKNIYAAGDVAEFQNTIYGIWPAAVDQGYAAALNALGITYHYRGTTPLHILKVAGLEVTTIGKKYPDQSGEEQIVYRHPEAGEYVKLIHNREYIQGALVLGVKGISYRLEKMIKKNVTARHIIGDLASGKWEVLRKSS